MARRRNTSGGSDDGGGGARRRRNVEAQARRSLKDIAGAGLMRTMRQMGPPETTADSEGHRKRKSQAEAEPKPKSRRTASPIIGCRRAHLLDLFAHEAMKSLLALVLLAQLLSCTADSVPEVPAEVVPPTVHKVPGCDDPETEAAARVAVAYINKHLKHGYKVDLNRIEKVRYFERRPHGKIMDLELDVVETTCHLVDPLPAENCTVRKREEHAVEGDCDVKMIEVDGHYKVLRTKCHSSPDSDEDFQKSCPNCNRLSRLNDTDVVNTVHAALKEYNAQNTTHDHYKLLEISRGHHLHLARGVYAEFAIVNTNCSAQHAKEHEDDCHVATGDHLHYGFCKASFHKSAAEDAADHHEVHCTVYDHQPGVHHHHLIHEHVEGKLPQAGRGHVHLDLIHSHNDTIGSHSHSDEVMAVEKPVPLVKRSILAALPECPGRYRHYDL
ncbi:PREDICTED: alpha-2-HS-glycoprotein [Gekko japonicus]|uniref:Alpha-2-HS-glycoprotein n=1 Tax=Gekko japonicus TaxID=146911 RepID=A0ABM1K7E0_GEKJA|nr:PREDICTED: alpha-2-HS-glycoprotein [Gekko japonicus]